MVQTAIREALLEQLTLMRRDPSEFTVIGQVKCKFCYKKTAYDISHPLSPSAGTWCPEHGWLAFDSVKIRPKGEEYVPRKKHRKVAA